MKKFTTIIAITLLAALLFTGCDFIPMKKDFSQYGITFSIAGEVTDQGANLLGYTTLDTKYGELTFSKMALDLGFSEGNIAKECESKESVGENGTIYFLAADDEGNIVTYYFVKDADGSTWQFIFTTPEDDYSKFMITNVFKSIEFVAAK
jgi:hypothetical protein